jgi:hypothetical protein
MGIVVYRAVAKRWLRKQRPLLDNAPNIHARPKGRTVFYVARAEMFNREFRSVVSFYYNLPPIKDGRSSASIKLTIPKALIGSIMTYTFPACELAADTSLLKLQPLQNKVLRIIANVPRCIRLSTFHMYTIITKKLCR